MTLFVHIGSHKTGTTSIQRFARDHRDTLRERGLWYPSYEEIGRNSHYGHHHVSHAIADKARDDFSLDDARAFITTIRQRRRDGETILLSAEPIYRHLLPTDGDYWSQRRAYVRRLREVIGGDDVRILAVLRRQDTFALSLFQESIKSTRDSRTFRQFIAREEHYFEYNLQLEIFREEFGLVDVLVYEDLKNGELIDAFFRHFGIDVAGLSKPTRPNASLPVELVEFKRLLNKTSASTAVLKDIGKKLSNWANGKPSGYFEDAQWIPRSEIVAFYESFVEKNEQLRLDFVRDRPAPLFPPLESGGRDLPVYTGMTMNRFLQLTTDILL